jgi:hypothetical protein
MYTRKIKVPLFQITFRAKSKNRKQPRPPASSSPPLFYMTRSSYTNITLVVVYLILMFQASNKLSSTLNANWLDI